MVTCMFIRIVTMNSIKLRFEIGIINFKIFIVLVKVLYLFIQKNYLGLKDGDFLFQDLLLRSDHVELISKKRDAFFKYGS